MIEKYLTTAKALFKKNRLETPLPMETTLIEFKTDDLEVSISHRYMRDSIYSVFGGISGERMFEDPGMDTLNALFLENQHVINDSICNLLNSEGIYSEASEKGLFLSNGRSVSSVGLWFLYHTNYYDKSDAPTFSALMNEEIEVVTQSLECIFAIIQHIIDNHPGTEDIKNLLPKQNPVELRSSKLVRRHINEAATKEMGSLFFSAVHHLEKAEEKVQRAYLNEAIEEKKIEKMN